VVTILSKGSTGPAFVETNRGVVSFASKVGPGDAWDSEVLVSSTSGEVHDRVGLKAEGTRAEGKACRGPTPESAIIICH
jgi:hypothetical protein